MVYWYTLKLTICFWMLGHIQLLPFSSTWYWLVFPFNLGTIWWKRVLRLTRHLLAMKQDFQALLYVQRTTLIQGQSTQTVFSKLALRDRNMQVRFFWKVVLKSWDLRNFGTTTSFHEMYTVCHLQSNTSTKPSLVPPKVIWFPANQEQEQDLVL